MFTGIIESIGNVEKFDKKGKNIELISTINLFCNLKSERKCYASTENDLYYSDTNHLTLKGANLITNKVEELINIQKLLENMKIKKFI